MDIRTLFNWVDWVIIVAVVYYGVVGWNVGFADLGVSFVTFVISLFLAVKFHQPVGDFLSQKFGVPETWTAVLGYIIVGFIAEAILAEIASVLIRLVPKRVISSKFNKWFGVAISVFNGFVIVSFFLLVIMALPLRGTVKEDVKNSRIGNWLVVQAEKIGGPIKSSISQIRETAISFLTVEPESKESIALDISPKDSEYIMDKAAESKMLELINGERKKAGIAPLVISFEITPIARAHSKDMFQRRYFSHVTPDGLTPADRLSRANINFALAGENIAYTPDLATAHTGLMNSPSHKENILDPSFHRVGIGIISTSSWGMMVTQNFTN